MNSAGARVLLSLPQMPQDPSSGAARSLSTICEMLADAGYSVRAVASTATERAVKTKPDEYLRSLGVAVTVERPPRKSPFRPEIRFERNGISYRLLDTAGASVMDWEKLYGRQFDLMFDDELRRFEPDLLITFGGTPGALRRQQRARRSGAKVVFGLRNLAYRQVGAFDNVDAIFTPSRFITDRYRASIGIESTPIPTPLDLQDVVAEDRQPIFVTIVNPSPEKGLMFVARLLEEAGARRPDVAFLVIEARGTAGLLARAGLAGGFDLRRHESILVSEPVSTPKDIYAGTRVLLVPSLWEEPSARVAAEAVANGIPAIVSDRGGMEETLNGGGFVLPIPAEITPQTTAPPDAAAVEPWLALILRLIDDEAFYAEASTRAREAGKMYAREAIAARYLEFFEKVLG